MRSRPLVRVLYERALVEPGSTFDVDVLLTSRTETPTDYLTVMLTAEAGVAIPQGKTYAAASEQLTRPQQFSWKPGVLTIREYRQRVRFVVPPNMPPSYRIGSGWCRVVYTVAVHVAIPLWIDRHASFTLPVASPTRFPNQSSTSVLIATHPQGPTHGEIYIEAGLDATQLRLGDELRGDVSFANVNVKRVRRVTIAFVVCEHTRSPYAATNVVQRWAATLVSGAPPEGESFPFRFAIPKQLWPSFDTQLFSLKWHFEVRVDVVLGSDVVLTIPIDVLRENIEMPPRSRRALPVGRERLARLWAMVAQRIGLSYEESEVAMLATRGAVSMKLVREAYEGTLGIVAHYRFPHLGLDARLGARGFLDGMVTRGHFESRNAVANKRFTIAGREPAQLIAFFDDALTGHLATATSVVLDDDFAHVRVDGNANSANALETVVRAALTLLDLFNAAVARIPVPQAMAAHETAWRDFAATYGGRFEPGRVWIHEATMNGFLFEIGTVWQPQEPKPLFTVARFPIEPPLDRAPTIEDALLSPSAREALRGLAGEDGFQATTTELAIALEHIVDDPKKLVRKLEAITDVLRALRGTVAAGPFR